MIYRNQQTVPAICPKNIQQLISNDADVKITLFALILLQFLEDALNIQQRQHSIGEFVLLRKGFDFEAVGRINGLNSASTIDDSSAFQQVSPESLIRLIKDQALCLLFEIGSVPNLDDMKFLALGLIESTDHRQAEFMNGIIGRCAFLLQIALEILHVLCFHAKDGECFK